MKREKREKKKKERKGRCEEKGKEEKFQTFFKAKILATALLTFKVVMPCHVV